MYSWFNTILANSLPFFPKILVRRFAAPYLAGEDAQEAIHCVRGLMEQGFVATLDHLGEFVRLPDEADAACAEYERLLNAISWAKVEANISIKLSQLGLKLSADDCYGRLITLLQRANNAGLFVRIDMEDSPCTQATLDMYRSARKQEGLHNVGVVLQSRLRRTLQDAQHLCEAGIAHVRLCKGVYLEPRTLAYQDSELIRRNYLLTLEHLFAHQATVGIATHDERLIFEAQRLIQQYQVPPERVEFQMLLGVDPQLRRLTRSQGHRVRIYVPYGAHWHAYCMRRMRENPTLAFYVLKNIVQPSSQP